MMHRNRFSIRLRPLPGWGHCGLGVILAGVVGLVFYYALIVPTPLPDHRLIVGWNDVVLHVLAFLSISVVAFMLLVPMVQAGLAVLGLGLMIEVLQSFSVSHHPSLADMVANSVGIGMAALLVLTGNWIWARYGRVQVLQSDDAAID